ERLAIDRSQFIDQLRARNIGTSVHFIPVHLHPHYKERFGYQPGDLKNAEYVYDRILSLPLYPGMTEEDVQDVIGAVLDVISSNRREFLMLTKERTRPVLEFVVRMAADAVMVNVAWAAALLARLGFEIGMHKEGV